MTDHPNTWAGVTAAAKDAGARFPELVAAQWALESGWGKHTSGSNNVFGLKGKPGTTVITTEYVNGKKTTVTDTFLDFDDLGACVEYLVERWYKDWDGHQGVNRAATRELAAKELVTQGYATDPAYAEKLIRLMADQAPAAAPAAAPASGGKPLFTLTALQETWLKKEPGQASELGEKLKVAVPKGKAYPVIAWEERAADAHVRVELGHGAGTWFIYQPHWDYQQKPAGEALLAQVDWSDFNCLVTPNLTVGEVLQWDTRRIPGPNASVRQRLLATAAEFQTIRDAWGRPLGVTSFYRPEPINRQVGGAPNSRHVTGQAMDIYPVGASLSGFYQWIAQRWRGGLGDGRARGFVHLDTDGGGFVPGGGVRPRRWWDY